MPPTFDPYHKWLGIPPHEQPPDHYRLLGISTFEQDSEVIDRAADRQMAYLRPFQIGANAAACQEMLSRIATARLCLLDGNKKSEYDRGLRTRRNAGVELAVAAPLALPVSPETPVRPPFSPEVPIASQKTAPSTSILRPPQPPIAQSPEKPANDPSQTRLPMEPPPIPRTLTLADPGPWYYHFMGETFGPFSGDELKRELANRTLDDVAWVRCGETAERVSVFSISGIKQTTGEPDKPAPARPVTAQTSLADEPQHSTPTGRATGGGDEYQLAPPDLIERKGWSGHSTPDAESDDLGRCPNCRRNMSSKTYTCYFCGYDLRTGEVRNPVANGSAIGDTTTEHRAGTILALGIAGFFFCGLILGGAALQMANTDLKAMESGRMDPSGRPLTQVGRIIAIVDIVTSALFILAMVLQK